mmetsp:Transcript_14319/g.38986  ORF Transcript_14319/g.38986 Transcript_14319/m.38986 type:complete len:241 (+) Transcript_14319:601-1323(+)
MSRRGLQRRVDNVNDLVEKKIVEHPVTAKDDDVALIGRDAVNCRTSLDYLQGDILVEIGVDSTIHTSQLQRSLSMPVDSLHLRVEHGLEPPILRVHAPKHEKLAIADGEDRNHRMQLAVYPGTVVQDAQDHCCGTQAFGRLVRFLEERHWASITFRGRHLLAWHQLIHGELFATSEQLVRQLRWIHPELLQLRHAVGNANHHWSSQCGVSIRVVPLRFCGVRLLVRSGTEAQRLVLLILF